MCICVWVYIHENQSTLGGKSHQIPETSYKPDLGAENWTQYTLLTFGLSLHSL